MSDENTEPTAPEKLVEQQGVFMLMRKHLINTAQQTPCDLGMRGCILTHATEWPEPKKDEE